MKTNYSILVIIHPRYDNGPVITRAKEIAAVMKASIHLLVCDDTKKAEKTLSEISDSFTNEGFKVTSEIAWHHSEQIPLLLYKKHKIVI